MWNLTRRHPDDETLVAHLDGELSGRAERKLDEHLKSCWRCRARLAGFEERIYALAAARANRVFPGPLHAEASYRKFQDRLQVLLSEAAPDGPVGAATPAATPPRWPLRAIGSVAGAAAALACALWIGRPPAPRFDPPAELAAARQFERILFESPQPLHQVVRVEIGLNAPAARPRVSRLEVWSDHASSRFSFGWETEAGEVRCALWRPTSGQERTYFREARQEASSHLRFLAGLDGSSVEEFERAFLRWIDANRWRPVSLGAEWAHFESLEGVSLKVRRVVAEGRAAIEFAASRPAAQGARRAVLTVDAATHRPLSLTIEYRSHTIRLVNERLETAPPGALPSRAFRPSLPPGVAARETPVPRPPAVEELDASEVQALYALHEAGACLGDPVEIVRRPSGRILVRGQVANLTRRRALERELAALPYLIVSLRSPEDGVQPGQVTRSLEVRSGASAMAERLGQVQASELSDRAVTAAQAALLEAWALRRLAEWAQPEKMERLDAESRRLVGLMGREHALALHHEIEEQRSALRPVLAGEETIASGAPLALDWQTATLRVFGDVERSERLTLTLFARPGFSSQHTDEAAQALWDAMSRAERNTRVLDVRLAAAFVR